MENNDLGRVLSEPRLGCWPLCGYAPGNYMGRCSTCNKEMRDVAKRSSQCLPCALTTAKSAMERVRVLEQEREAYRTQAVNRGWNWRLCEAYGRDEYQRQLESEVDRTLEVMLGRKTFAESLRDSDGSPQGRDAQQLDGEAAIARAEGIAQTIIDTPND